VLVALDAAFICGAFLWHHPAGFAILVLSVAVLMWRLFHDHQELRWQDKGGYEIVYSCVWLRFTDASAHRVEMRKKQVLRAHVRGLREVVESHIRGDGSVAEPRVRPGHIIDRKRVGAGWRYLIDLEEEMKIGKDFERWFEAEYIDCYPDPARETHIIHVKRTTRITEAVLEFHPDLRPDRVLATIGGLGHDLDIHEAIKDEDGDRRRWHLKYEAAPLGSEIVLEWYWKKSGRQPH